MSSIVDDNNDVKKRRSQDNWDLREVESKISKNDIQDEPTSSRTIDVNNNDESFLNEENFRKVNNNQRDKIIAQIKESNDLIQVIIEPLIVTNKLLENTDEQRKCSIYSFINAMKMMENFSNEIIEMLNKCSSKIFERYLFCEIVMMYLKESCCRLNDNILKDLKELKINNTFKLYQEFIFQKSKLYLKKHLKVESEILNNENNRPLIFNILGAYNQVIELYALKQAFNLSDITQFIKCINFDTKALKMLEETGLLTISPSNDGLNFNHETYQEFYAALALIRGILSGSGGLYDLTIDLVKKNRYDPKYDFILSFASQFSVSGGSMIPGYDLEKDLLKFWQVLEKDGDLIGGAALRLYRNCTSELQDDEKLKLRQRKIFEKEYQKSFNHNQSKIDDPIDGLPISFTQKDDFIDVIEEKIDTSKEKVAGCFRKLQKNGSLNKDHIKLLEEATVNKSSAKFDGYWAVNGGIEAIGYTGHLFSNKLANYLLKRSQFYLNNEKATITALKTIYQSLEKYANDTQTGREAQENCFYVINELLYNGFKANREHLLKLLCAVDSKFINYLIGRLKKFELIEDPFKIIKNIFFVAEKQEYAVVLIEETNGTNIAIFKSWDSKLLIPLDNFNPIYNKGIQFILEQLKTGNYTDELTEKAFEISK